MIRKPTGSGRLSLALAVTAIAAAAVAAAILIPNPQDGPPTPREGYQALYDAGVANLKPGFWPRAIQKLKQAVEIDPRQTMGHYQLGVAYFNDQDHKKALVSLNTVLEQPEHRRYVEISPTYYLLFEMRGHIYSNLAEYEESRANFLKAVELNPEAGEIYHYLAWTELELGEIQEALKSGLRSLELGYVTYKSTFAVGRACQKLGRYEEAEQHYLQSIQFNPGYTSANRNLANVLRKLGRKEEGNGLYDLAEKLALADDEMEKFRQRMVIEPVQGEEYRQDMERYSVYCFQFGKYPELVDCMAQLLAMDPGNAGYHYQMGVAKGQLGEAKLAEEHYRHALQLDKTMIKAMNGLALVLAVARRPEDRRPAEALLWAEAARAKGYKGVEVLAEVLHANGQTEQALRLVEEKLTEGGSWKALHERQREEFRGALLEREVEPIGVEGDR